MVVKRFVVVLLVMVFFVGCGGEEDSGGVATVVGTVPAIGSQIDPDGVLVINFDDGANIEGGVVTVNGDSISLVNNQATVVFSGLPVGKPFTFDVSWRNTDGTKGGVDTVFRVNQLEPEVVDGIQQPPEGVQQPPKEIDTTRMVLIPAGSFEMGDHFDEGNNIERPVHRVELDAFYMDVNEVTVGQFKQFVNQSGYDYDLWNEVAKYSPGDDYPMVYVNWNDATAYAKWAGKRLPTEVEWEYAARGGLIGKRYPWGDDINVARDYVNYGGTGGKDKWERCSPVGSFAANGYGLYDMAGNVWEWCSDWYGSDYYSKSPLRNPQGPGLGGRRVLRGGSWRIFIVTLRVAYRGLYNPALTSLNFGFRCVSGF